MRVPGQAKTEFVRRGLAWRTWRECTQCGSFVSSTSASGFVACTLVHGVDTERLTRHILSELLAYGSGDGLVVEIMEVEREFSRAHATEECKCASRVPTSFANERLQESKRTIDLSGWWPKPRPVVLWNPSERVVHWHTATFQFSRARVSGSDEWAMSEGTWGKGVLELEWEVRGWWEFTIMVGTRCRLHTPRLPRLSFLSSGSP